MLLTISTLLNILQLSIVKKSIILIIKNPKEFHILLINMTFPCLNPQMELFKQ